MCAAALAATSLAGCGQSASSTAASEAASGSGSTASGETAEPVTLEFWTIALQPTFTDFLNGLIDKYEAENPGVTINWVDLPYDSIQQKLVTATAGGTSPDVVNLNTQMTLTLAGKGALVDLEKEANRGAEERLRPEPVRFCPDRRFRLRLPLVRLSQHHVLQQGAV